MAAWATATAMWVYAFFTVGYQGWYALAASSFFLGCQHFYGGLEIVLAGRVQRQAGSERQKKRK